MALGGGTFVTQNKILPGTFINFVSRASASATLSDRGIATVPYTLDWGTLGVTEVSAGDFQTNSLRLLGYDFADPKLKGLRDLFRNIRTAYLFRLGTGGTAADSIYATAKCVGTRGNDLKVVIAANVDDPARFDVSVFFGTVQVFAQTVTAAAELRENDFVTWKTGAALTVTAGTPLTGGVSPTVTNGDYQTYLDQMESFSFNAMGCPSNDTALKGLFTAYTKRMRDERGAKFQCVTYDNAADFEGVINVMNKTTDGDDWGAVYWVTGVAAGTAVNASALNKVYDGEFTIDVNCTQAQLEAAITGGKFAFHRVGSDIRVLADINSLVTVTADKGDIFKQNQTIRVIDQIANDIAVLFDTKYLGAVPNDADGRVSLWSDIVQQHQQLQTIRAIENFTSADVTVTQGDTKQAVSVASAITIVNAMGQLYMVVTVS